MLPATRIVRIVRASAGGAVWAALAGVVAWVLASAAPGRGPVGSAWKLAFDDPREMEALLPGGSVHPGDRILVFRDGVLRPCGEVVSMERPAVGTATVRIALFPDAGVRIPPPPGTRLRLMDARGTLEWALGRVLSPARRAELGRALADLVAERREWFEETFGGMLKELVRGAVADVASEFWAFVRAREDRLREIGMEVIERAKVRWEPIFRDLIWPRAVERLSPLAESIGNELWDSVPWGEIAAAAARAAGAGFFNLIAPEVFELPTDYIEGWRDEYIRDTAIPAVERRLPEAMRIISDVLVEVSRDPRAGEALRATLVEDALGHRKVIALLAEAFTTAVVTNPRLHERIARFANDPRVQRALFDLAERLEPELIGIARSFLLDERTGRLHPEIAMLVRVRVLFREPRWILIEPGPAAPAGAGEREAPLVIVPFGGTRTEIWQRPIARTAPWGGGRGGGAPAPAPATTPTPATTTTTTTTNRSVGEDVDAR